MDDRALLFIEVMIAIAIVGVLAFLVSLIARTARSQQATVEGPASSADGPQWYVYVLAIILLVVVAALLIWELSPTDGGQLTRTGITGDDRSLIFFIVMLVVGAAAVVGFLIYAFAAMPRQTRSIAAADAHDPSASVGGAPVQTSSGTSLLGLVVLASAFLLLNWIYVPSVHQYALMLYLIYPASIAVSLVLLFDKATRAWSAHGGAETTREWMFCDTIVFLLILGFLNLLETKAEETYAVVLWDMIYVVLFFFTFWIVDRTASRIRFLVAYGYLIAVPILLLIWRAIQGVELPDTLTWWNSIWPFFALAIIFFVLEILALVAGRNSETKSAVPAIKDGLFVILYAVLLIVAVPGAER